MEIRWFHYRPVQAQTMEEVEEEAEAASRALAGPISVYANSPPTMWDFEKNDMRAKQPNVQWILGCYKHFKSANDGRAVRWVILHPLHTDMRCPGIAETAVEFLLALGALIAKWQQDGVNAQQRGIHLLSRICRGSVTLGTTQIRHGVEVDVFPREAHTDKERTQYIHFDPAVFSFLGGEKKANSVCMHIDTRFTEDRGNYWLDRWGSGNGHRTTGEETEVRGIKRIYVTRWFQWTELEWEDCGAADFMRRCTTPIRCRTWEDVRVATDQAGEDGTIAIIMLPTGGAEQWVSTFDRLREFGRLAGTAILVPHLWDQIRSIAAQWFGNTFTANDVFGQAFNDAGFQEEVKEAISQRTVTNMMYLANMENETPPLYFNAERRMVQLVMAGSIVPPTQAYTPQPIPEEGDDVAMF